MATSVPSFVYPEDVGTGARRGDWNDAANFAAVYDTLSQGDYVAKGLNFTYNPGDPSLDISSGKALLSKSSVSTRDHGSGAETRDEGGQFITEVDSISRISLTDNDVNYVFISIDLSSDDTTEYVINTDDVPPPEPRLKIGVIDTGNDSVNEINRNPSASFDSITDGAGVTHSGELADISDVGGISDISSITSSTTASDNEVILADASGGDIAVTLPSPTEGFRVFIKKISNSGNNVLIETPGSADIEAKSLITMTVYLDAITLIADGNNWWII